MSSDDDVEFIGDNNDENVGGRASGRFVHLMSLRIKYIDMFGFILRTKRKVSYIDSDSGSDALEESDEFEEEAHAEVDNINAVFDFFCLYLRLFTSTLFNRKRPKAVHPHQRRKQQRLQVMTVLQSPRCR